MYLTNTEPYLLKINLPIILKLLNTRTSASNCIETNTEPLNSELAHLLKVDKLDVGETGKTQRNLPRFVIGFLYEYKKI